MLRLLVSNDKWIMMILEDWVQVVFTTFVNLCVLLENFFLLIVIAWKKCLLSSFLVARNFVTNRFVIFEWTIGLIIRF